MMCKKILATSSLIALAMAFVGACSPSAGSEGGGAATNTVEHEVAKSVIDSAKAEKSLVLYTALDQTVLDRVKKDFGARYGIQLTTLRGPSGTITERFLSELQAGAPQADLVSVAAESFFKAEQAKSTFVKLDASKTPAMKEYGEDAFAFDSFKVQTSPYEIAYNTDLVKGDLIPESYADLVKPEYKGLLGAPTWTASTSYPRVLDFFAKEFGDDWLTKYTAQKPRIFQSVVPGLQALAAGEIGIYPIATPTYLQPLLDKGAPVKTVKPAKTTGFSEDLAISSKAPHPNAALLFMNYAMSAEGQKVINGSTGVSMLEGASEQTLPTGYVPPPVQVDPARVEVLYGLVGAR